MSHAIQPVPSIADSLPPVHPRSRWLAVLASAVLMTLAFPPADLGLLAWFGLAPLLWAVARSRRPRGAFALGYVFGCLHWGATITWIGTTVVWWSGTPLGWLAWVGLTAIKALWFGLFGFAGWWVIRRSTGTVRALALASAWTAVEWLRTQGSLAMPWSLIGYTQVRWPPVVQVADLVGVFGVTFALVLVNAGIAAALDGGAWPRDGALLRWRPLALAACVVAWLLGYGALALAREYSGVPADVTVVQTDVRSIRDEARDRAADMARYEALVAEPGGAGTGIDASRTRIVVWPESAAPDDAIGEPWTREAFGRIAMRSGAWQVVGTNYHDAAGRDFNSAALFAPDGALVGRYDKAWLVPFGEYTPARQWIPFAETFHVVDRPTTPGDTSRLLAAGSARIGVLICYESVFPVLARSQSRVGANLLVSITNDSWSGRSAELAQHVAMTAMRAVETRRYVATAATTGITAIIDPTGRMVAAPPYRATALRGTALLRTGETPYVRWGDWFVIACLGWVLVVVARGAGSRPGASRGAAEQAPPGTAS